MIKSNYLVGLLCLLVAVLLGLSTVLVNAMNLKQWTDRGQQAGYMLVYNAVINPPSLKNQLNNESIIVTEDSQNVGDYLLGDGAYPFVTLKHVDYYSYIMKQINSHSAIQYEPVYNGRLFRWAYLKPQLKEEIFSFNVNQMQSVPDEVLHRWLSHINNIFCIGYDNFSAWHDKTALFKKNLLQEKARRQMLVNAYQVKSSSAILNKALHIQKLSVPDAEMCQLTCDKDKRCHGFNYIEPTRVGRAKCIYYETARIQDVQPCSVCQAYIKADDFNQS
jgi:hypothetical protein